ncbi:MAG TPA: hypothetical protein VFB22_16415 [Candidatus Baltobacteraceae bacterium]|nr:hypothetical protein [Candidatus Baltobacteraceae bacterium]
MNTQRLGPAILATCLVAVAGAPALAQAAPHGSAAAAQIAQAGPDDRRFPHPRARHAISDLQAAHDVLAHPGPRGYDPRIRRALDLIGSAVQAAGRVALLDERRLQHPERSGADAAISGSSALQTAREYIDAALHDLNATEDNLESRPYLEQARRQTTEASGLVRDILAHGR